MRVLLMVRARRARGANCSSVQHPTANPNEAEKSATPNLHERTPLPPTFTTHWGIHSPRFIPKLNKEVKKE